MVFKYEVALMMGCMGLETMGAHAHTSPMRPGEGKWANQIQKILMCMCPRKGCKSRFQSLAGMTQIC